MMKKIVAMVFCIILLVAFGLAVTSPCEAQQKHNRTYKELGENTKYTVQHIIDVGDIPGHQIRIYEIHRTEPANSARKYEGVAVKESYERNFSDYVNWSGHHWGYGVVLLENGDKIYYKRDGLTNTVLLPGGGTKGTFSGMTTITGGTGKLRGIRGTSKYAGIFDHNTGFNECTVEEEYWME